MKFLISTRPEEKADRIKKGCFEVINVPVTRLIPKALNYDAILAQEKVEFIVFTSAYGASLFFANSKNHAFRYLGIGKSTCAEVKEHGYECEYPEHMDSEGLADLILERCRGKKVALIRSSKANEIINSKIKGIIDFLDIRNYDVEADPGEFRDRIGDKDCIGSIITSSMEAEIVSEILRTVKKPVYAIGHVTAKRLNELGIKPEITGSSDFRDLLNEIEKKVC